MAEKTIYLHGEFGYDITSEAVIPQIDAAIQQKVELLTVDISSIGGDITTGREIMGAIERVKLAGIPVATRCLSFAYSMGAVLFLQGTKGMRKLSEFAEIMVHEAAGVGFGKPNEIRKAADTVEEMGNNLLTYVLSGNDSNKDEIVEAFKTERMIGAADAIRLGLADGYVEKLQAVAYYKKPIQEMNTNITKDEAKGLFADLKAYVKNLLHPVRNASTTTTDGVTFYYDGDLGVNTAVFSDEAMTVKLPDDTYMTADNTMVVVDGIVTEFTEASQNNADLDAANARIAELETQLADATAKAADAEKKIGEVQASFDAKITELENKILGEGGNPDALKNNPPAPAAKAKTVAEIMRELQAKNEKRYAQFN